MDLVIVSLSGVEEVDFGWGLVECNEVEWSEVEFD